MTKTPPPPGSSVRFVTESAVSMESIKEQHPQWPPTEADAGNHGLSPPPPASVMALAAAARQSAGGRKSATGSPAHAHRRSQTIVAAGGLEMELLKKHKAVEELHSELEFTNKALEESQEEAQLAARIGQTLLQRNQEMGAEIESKAIELQNRAEHAEQEVRVLEKKLSLAITRIRSLDMARTRATLEAEQLTQELDDSRTTVLSVRNELVRTKTEAKRTEIAMKRLEEELEVSRAQVAAMEATQLKLQAELVERNDRIEVLASTDRYNVEHISRLEIENQSICQQQHARQHREQQFVFENEALASKVATQATILKEYQTRSQELEQAIVGLHKEVEDLREALVAEQMRVLQLTRVNHELEARVDRQRRAQHGKPGNGNPESEEDDVSDDAVCSQLLRSGSLFHELARQLRSELQDAKAQQQGATKQLLSSASTTTVSSSPEDHEDEEDEVESPGTCSVGSTPTVSLDSPARCSTRTSRNPSSNNTDSVNDTEETTTVSIDKHGSPSATKNKTTTRVLPPLQLEQRHSHVDRYAATPACNEKTSKCHDHDDKHKDNAKDEDDDDCFLKEFFLLTAAAVKIAGGGLRNDACNIHNEDLYTEATRAGITFDQFHKWLERRLESDLEISLSPQKSFSSLPAPVPEPVAPRRSVATSFDVPPLTPARRIISFWTR